MISGTDIRDYKDANYKQPLTKGVKDDGAKPQMALLDSEYLEGVARVLTFGANKYAPDNWRLGIEYRRLISALYRHLGAINRGEDRDNETGELHAYHMGCCLQFLASMTNHRPDLDDRYKSTDNRYKQGTT